MDDEECRSWQFLMNEALDGHSDHEDEVLEEATLVEDPIKEEEAPSVPPALPLPIPEEPEIPPSIPPASVPPPPPTPPPPASVPPPPPTPPLPPDPAWFITPAVKIRVTAGVKKPNSQNPPSEGKKNRPLIDELESVLKKRLSLMEEGGETEMAPRPSIIAASVPPPVSLQIPEESLIRQGKSSYKLLISQLNNNAPPAFIAQNHHPANPIKRKL